MKTPKFSSILWIVLTFVYCNANAQKPIVENYNEFLYTISPSTDLPCVTEDISGLVVMDGFFTNSSFEVGIYNYTYHEKGKGTLSGASTGDYVMSWNYNEKDMNFSDGFPKHWSGMAHTNITHNGKLFMTIDYHYIFIWNEPWTNPIVWRYTENLTCK
jgi:hypothetical protein